MTKESISKESTRHIEIINKSHLDRLLCIFSDIKETKANSYFSPHKFTKTQANKICNNNGNDLYVISIENDITVGYGMLRGWDEGFQIPSLGIYISSLHRGSGIGKWFMNELHKLAKQRGSNKVRLTVKKDNLTAINLYKSLGYELADFNNSSFIGSLSI